MTHHEHIPSRDTPLIDRLSQRIAELHELVRSERRKREATEALVCQQRGTILALQRTVDEKNWLIDAMRACRDNEERD